MERSSKRERVRRRFVSSSVTRYRRLRAERLEIRMLMAADLALGTTCTYLQEIQSSPSEMGPVLLDTVVDESFDDNYFPDDRPVSDVDDETNWILQMDPGDVDNLIEFATPAVLGEFTPQTLSFTTLANGMPILNSLPGAPTSVFLDFDGDSNSPATTPYDVDGDAATFNTTEQNTIAEAWRQLSTYFAMFNTNVTTIEPAASHPKAWTIVGNNIVGGYSAVNVFPNTRVRSCNQSSDARNRVSGIAHEVGHNFGLQHQSDFDNLGFETADYSRGYDELHVPIMGVDFQQRVRKWIIGHTLNASALQDDVAVIAGKISAQPGGGDGFRPDDHGGTTATATALTSQNNVQYETGIIERLNDVDAFSFISTGQSITVSATADFPSGVDLKLEIYDALGVLMAAKDSDVLNDQAITLVLPSGTYYALVSSSGNYGDLGTYNVAVRTLPSGWSSGDVGIVGITGFSQFHSSTNSFVLGASGADIGGNSDEMQFARQTLTGDGSIIARVTSLTGTDGNAKAGIEIRESTAGGSKHVSLTPTRSGGVKLISRSSTGGSSTTVSSASANFAPVWVRLTRVGNVFTAATSTNGTAWTNLGSAITISMNATVQIGLVATARNDRAFNVAEFTNVALTGTLGVTAPTPNSLPAPTGVSVTRDSGASLVVSWADQANETGYRVERSTDGAVFTTAGTTAAGVTSYQDFGLFGTMRYFYRVRALNASGASVPSVTVNALNRPTSVRNLETTAYSTTQIVLDWIETSGETGYRIERSTDGTNFTTIGTVGANIPSYTDSGRTSGVTYHYRVTPTSAFGDGVAATTTGVTRLVQVTGLVFDSVTSSQTQLRWTDIATETGYRIERSTNGTTFTQIATVAANVTTYTDATVSPATEYYYRVLGTAGDAVSVYNLIFAATPPTTPIAAPWSSVDIGTVAGRGSSSLTSGTFKIISSGSTIGGTNDSFRFTYQPINGNGSIIARIASLEDTAGSARLGVMIRETLNNNSKFAFMSLRPPTTNAQMMWRAGAGISTSTTDGASLSAPNWVRLTRAGNTFTAETSTNGTTWTLVGQTTFTMTANAFIGLAATANSTTELNTATATNVSVEADNPIAITSTDRIYNGLPYAATASIVGNLPLPTLSYVYYSDAAGTTVIPAPVNVGTYYVRAVSAGNSGNAAAQSAISTFRITPFALSITAVGQSKVYDGTTAANVTFSDNRFAGDVLTISGTSTFNTKNVGTAKPISVTGISLSGADAINYTFNTTAATTGNVNPKGLVATATALNKVYNGNTSASVTISLVGIVGTDSVTGSATGNFDTKNAGVGKAVAIGVVTLSGTDRLNYTVGVASPTTANIVPRSITGSITAANKPFDGSTAATILTRSLNGVLAGDVVSYTGGTATFDTAAVGNGKTVTATDLELAGTDAANYSVNSTATTTASITQPVATIASRHVFYNNATGDNLSSNGAADNAIASDKFALLPGEASTYVNYTNYSRGLNGVIVDINHLPSTTTESQLLASLQFAHWNGIDETGFAALPTAATATVTILPGSGTSGSTRVKITFPNNTLQNTWLRVSVVANPETALAADDVFYFGNVIGEMNSGNTTTRLRVNATDTGVVRSNQSTSANSALVSNWFDVNRDGRVNATDTGIVRSNQQTSGIVAPITAPSVLSSLASSAIALVTSSESIAGSTMPLETRNVEGSAVVVAPVKKLQATAVSVRSAIASPTVTNPVSAAEKPDERRAELVQSVDLYFASL